MERAKNVQSWFGQDRSLEAKIKKDLDKTAKEEKLSFIKVTPKERELVSQHEAKMKKLMRTQSCSSTDKEPGTMDRAPTGMSGMDCDDDKSDKSDEKFDPVYIPDDFKKPRNQKLQE